MDPLIRRSALGSAVLLAVGLIFPGFSEAKVSVESTLCYSQSQNAIDPYASAILNRLAGSARALSAQYGKPEMVIVTTNPPRGAVELVRDTEAMAAAILQFLQGVGIAYKEHGTFHSAGDSIDLGCAFGETAVEVEILFAHKLNAP